MTRTAEFLADELVLKLLHATRSSMVAPGLRDWLMFPPGRGNVTAVIAGVIDGGVPSESVPETDTVELTHTAETGTVLEVGRGRLPDAVRDVLRNFGFKWGRSITAYFRPRSQGLARTSLNVDGFVRAMAAVGYGVDVSGVTEADAETARAAKQAYHERRAEKHSGRAARHGAAAQAAFQRSDDISQRFEMGQPILVGHHSEARARRDQARMHGLMHKSVEAQDASSASAYRAEAAERAAAKYSAEAVERRASADEFNTELAKLLQGLKRDIGATAIRGGYRGTGTQTHRRQIFVAGPTGDSLDVWLDTGQARLGSLGPSVSYEGKTPAQVYEGIRALLASAWKVTVGAPPKWKPTDAERERKVKAIFAATGKDFRSGRPGHRSIMYDAGLLNLDTAPIETLDRLYTRKVEEPAARREAQAKGEAVEPIGIMLSSELAGTILRFAHDKPELSDIFQTINRGRNDRSLDMYRFTILPAQVPAYRHVLNLVAGVEPSYSAAILRALDRVADRRGA